MLRSEKYFYQPIVVVTNFSSITCANNFFGINTGENTGQSNSAADFKDFLIGKPIEVAENVVVEEKSATPHLQPNFLQDRRLFMFWKYFSLSTKFFKNTDDNLTDFNALVPFS